MTITPERILIVLHTDGPAAGQIHGAQIDGLDEFGRSVAGLPVTAAEIGAFLPASAAMLAQIAELQAAVAAAIAERDEARSARDATADEASALRQQIAAGAAVVDRVPQVVTNYQARCALIAAGLFDAVDTAVKAQGAASAAYQAWEYANEVHRRSPLITSLGAALGLDDAAIDALFVAAAKSS